MDEADLKRLEELNKKDQGKENVDEAAEAEKKAEEEDRFAKKWAGVLLIGCHYLLLFYVGKYSECILIVYHCYSHFSCILLGTQIPAIFAMFTVVTGQIVLNTWEGQCGYALNCMCSFTSVNSSFLFTLKFE
jgi:hypothetical protein